MSMLTYVSSIAAAACWFDVALFARWSASINTRSRHPGLVVVMSAAAPSAAVDSADDSDDAIVDDAIVHDAPAEPVSFACPGVGCVKRFTNITKFRRHTPRCERCLTGVAASLPPPYKPSRIVRRPFSTPVALKPPTEIAPIDASILPDDGMSVDGRHGLPDERYLGSAICGELLTLSFSSVVSLCLICRFSFTDDNEHAGDEGPPPDRDHPIPPDVSADLDAIRRWHYLWATAFQVRNRISATAMHQLFTANKMLVELLMNHAQPAFQETYAAKDWPVTANAACKLVNIDVDRFERHAVCPRPECGAVYPLAEAQRKIRCDRHCELSVEQPLEMEKAQLAAIEKREGEGGVKALRCGTLLLKRVNRSMDKKKVDAAITARLKTPTVSTPIAGLSDHPQLLLTTVPLAQSLLRLRARPGFEQKCNWWRSSRYRTRKNGSIDYSQKTNLTPLLGDLCDGRMWHRYLYVTREGKPWSQADERALANEPLTTQTMAHSSSHKSRRATPAAAAPAASSSVPSIDSVNAALSRATAGAKPGDRGTVKIPFLAADGTFALALNIDWFQPYKSMNYSMGAIYLTVLNLPRDERNLIENQILFALPPGPKSTSRQQLQGILRLLTAELSVMFDHHMEVQMRCAGSPAAACAAAPAAASAASPPSPLAFLFMAVCDSPAARQTSGFLSHAAMVNCTNCTNSHPFKNSLSDVRDPKYHAAITTGDHDQWNGQNPRSDETHRAAALRWTTTHTGRQFTDDEVAEEVEGSVAVEDVDGEDSATDDDQDPVVGMAFGDEYDTEADDDDADERAIAAEPVDPMEIDGEEPNGSRLRSRVAAAASPSASSAAAAAPSASSAAAAAESANKSIDRLYLTPANGVRALHERAHGSRYCAVMDLPYFDTVRGTPLDVMHNVFLGVCKTVMRLMTTVKGADYKGAKVNNKFVRRTAVLSKADLIFLQSFVDLCECPSEIGRIPNKIAANMSNFKAAEWKNWAGIFCVPAIRHLREKYRVDGKQSLVTDEHMSLLIALQELVSIMQGYTISGVGDMFDNDDPIGRAHLLTIDVMIYIELLYGRQAVTPNMHWSGHLREMILDYGPPAGWWCNSYERYNGLLGAAPYTPAHIEVCVMRRFILMNDIGERVDQTIHSLPPDGKVGERSLLEQARPCRQDFRRVLQLLRGNIVAAAVVDAGTWTVGIEQSMSTTPAGRSGHRYKLTSPEWADVFTRFNSFRVGANRPKGFEAFPGRMIPAAKYAGRLTTAAHDMNTAAGKKWHKQFGEFISADHLIDCLSKHYGIQHFTDFINWDEQDFRWQNDALKWSATKKLEFLRRELNFSVGEMIQVYDSMHFAGDRYGSKIAVRTKRHSYVSTSVNKPGRSSDADADADADPRQPKRYKKSSEELLDRVERDYGQIQFFFSHFFPLATANTHMPRQQYWFAVVKYYQLGPKLNFGEDDGYEFKGDINTFFPIFSPEFRAKCEYNVIPILCIDGKWIPAITPAAPGKAAGRNKSAVPGTPRVLNVLQLRSRTHA